MILHGFALATAREMGLAVADVDAAVLWRMTERIGVAAGGQRGAGGVHEGLSHVKGNLHIQFLDGGEALLPPRYPLQGGATGWRKPLDAR